VPALDVVALVLSPLRMQAGPLLIKHPQMELNGLPGYPSVWASTQVGNSLRRGSGLEASGCALCPITSATRKGRVTNVLRSPLRQGSARSGTPVRDVTLRWA